VKIVTGTCIELCVYICHLLLFVKISLFQMQKQCYVVLSAVTKSVEIQRAGFTSYNILYTFVCFSYVAIYRMAERP
jgi:hypothetical protein